MAYTVKQLAAMSGVSVRTLHFYDETGLLRPAYLGANGYRFYEEAQLLTLQQILFYRELGFELKEIKRILGQADFNKAAALQGHRRVLEANLAHTRQLLTTIDTTIQHLKGVKPMQSEEMFAGFSVGAGDDRFGEHVQLGGEPNDCKVSGQDTSGAMCAFEFCGQGGWPRHLHYGQDEWVYVIAGELDFLLGQRRFSLRPGECVFVPRNLAHAWNCRTGQTARVLDVYQPAGTIEEFFRYVGKFNGGPAIHEALSLGELHQVFHTHGMDLVGPPLAGEWAVDQQGRITYSDRTPNP